MARSSAKKRVRKQQDSTTPLAIGGIVVVLAVVLFIFSQSGPTPEENPMENEAENTTTNIPKKKSTKSTKLSLRMTLDTLNEKAEIELVKNSLSLNGLEPLLEILDDVKEKRTDFLGSSLIGDYHQTIQKIQKQIDLIAENEFMKIKKEEEAYLKDHQWEKARDVWKKFPDQLKASPIWYSKAIEAPKQFEKSKEDRFLEDIKLLNEFIEAGNEKEAKKLRDVVMAYANEDQKEALIPIVSQIRGMKNKNSGNSTNLTQTETKKKNPVEDEFEEGPPLEDDDDDDDEQGEQGEPATDPREVVAEKLFIQGEKLLEDGEFQQAKDIFLKLQEEYAATKFVQAVLGTIKEMYHKANIAAAPESDKFTARLQGFFKGTVVRVKGTKDTFRIEYDFHNQVQLEDFEAKRENGKFNDWEIRPGGLFGTSQHALYWKPNLIGDVEVDVSCRPSKIDNLGICILATGFHRRYVFYPSLKDDWARWASGDGAIVSTKPERYKSIKLGQKALGLSYYKQDLEDTTKSIFLKVQRRFDKKKKKVNLYLWASKKPISPKEKPQLEGQDEELENGQVVFLGASGTLFTRITITCRFDPGWLRQFR